MSKFKVEYAGFRYIVTKHVDGPATIEVEPGQHAAAHKWKHLNAALAEWRRDNV